jgi:hypothetical protein
MIANAPFENNGLKIFERNQLIILPPGTVLYQLVLPVILSAAKDSKAAIAFSQ